MTQLALFDATDPRELPLIIADQHHFALTHIERENGNLYAVQDWIAGVALTNQPRKFWNDMKRRADKAGVELSAQCGQLPYKAKNGKTYQIDFANAELLYMITQRMDANTGIRTQILRFLAKSGVAIDRQRRQAAVTDPLWLKARQDGKTDRKSLTSAIATHGIRITPLHYGLATNAVYEGLYGGRNAKVLRQQLTLSDKENLRDHQPRQALLLESLAEATATDLINQKGKQSPEEIIATIYRTAQMFGVQAAQISDLLGIDIATGLPLLSEVAS